MAIAACMALPGTAYRGVSGGSAEATIPGHEKILLGPNDSLSIEESLPMLVPALLLLAAPIAFGMMRLTSTGSDYRYVLVALASTAAALALAARPRLTRRPLRQALLAGIAATLCAAAVAALLGARSTISVVVVALGFAACSASGATLLVRSRHAGSS